MAKHTHDGKAFCTGWREGHELRRALGIQHRSYRDAVAAHPYYTASEIEAYLNGFEDGAQGDTFRLHLITRGTADPKPRHAGTDREFAP